MKLFSLALRNIKKSIKDYSIYFITLVIAVAIFYIFNSIDSQTAMMSIKQINNGNCAVFSKCFIIYFGFLFR